MPFTLDQVQTAAWYWAAGLTAVSPDIAPKISDVLSPDLKKYLTERNTYEIDQPFDSEMLARFVKEINTLAYGDKNSPNPDALRIDKFRERIYLRISAFILHEKLDRTDPRTLERRLGLEIPDDPFIEEPCRRLTINSETDSFTSIKSRILMDGLRHINAQCWELSPGHHLPSHDMKIYENGGIVVFPSRHGMFQDPIEIIMPASNDRLTSPSLVKAEKTQFGFDYNSIIELINTGNYEIIPFLENLKEFYER